MGEKVGMTQSYDQDGNARPVTVVKAGPCTVVQVKTVETDGYSAIQVGFGNAKPTRVSRPRRGHFEKRGVGLFTHLREFRTDKASEFKVGQVLTVKAFQPGDIVDVQGVTKGRGFQGVMKRHGKHGGPASHGSTAHRRPGSIGMCAWPGRVFKNMKLPGHMGVDLVTTKNLTVVDVHPEDDLLLIGGAMPGHRGGLVAVFNRAHDFEARDALKAEEPTEVEEKTDEVEDAAEENKPQQEGQTKE
jgi:large subunit ribosomal protein L3